MMPIRRMLAAALIAAPLAAESQTPMTFAELSALTAPAPTRRISYGPGQLQFGNLRLPNTMGPHPVVLFIHGGCWLSRFDIAHAAALEQALADSGYAVWSLEYRRVGDDGGGWPGTFQDIANGADHLREIAKEYRLDLSRVVAMGHSAGGQFALWLAARARVPRNSALYVANPLPIIGVVGLAPAPDLEGLHARGVCENVIDKLMGGSPADHPDRYQAASPMRLAPIGVPQVLIVGAQDRSWGPVGRAYHERTVAVGDTTVQLVEASQSGHFDIVAPPTTSWRLVVEAVRTMFERQRGR